MKAEKMMKLIGDADDEYVQSAYESRKQKKAHKPLRLVFRAVAAAAIIMSLAITAYATDFAGIKSLRDGSLCKIYDSYQKLDTAEKKAGFEIDAKKSFTNGYSFERMEVESTDAYDENDVKKLTYNEITILYKNGADRRLSLHTHPYLEEIPVSDIPAAQTRQLADIQVEYRESLYKFLPAEKEGNLTAEEEIWQQQPGHYISYFSGVDAEASESKITSLSWTKDGICYLLMDMEGAESADSLFSMAEELITAP